jgi:hypothetical protein
MKINHIKLVGSTMVLCCIITVSVCQGQQNATATQALALSNAKDSNLSGSRAIAARATLAIGPKKQGEQPVIVAQTTKQVSASGPIAQLAHEKHSPNHITAALSALPAHNLTIHAQIDQSKVAAIHERQKKATAQGNSQPTKR